MIHVYKAKGPWSIGGVSMDVKCINDTDLSDHIDDGWSISPITAKTKKTPRPKVVNNADVE
jgi:hypothetical protein